MGKLTYSHILLINISLFLYSIKNVSEELGGEGGGRGDQDGGNTCKSMADSCHCMTKTTAIL